ncbi:MAG: endo-1,4-beta-xylanase [Planctomycetia bacterium]|nr:endo-1,4-beta-xylanase [Planctomycetia bacterium]
MKKSRIFWAVAVLPLFVSTLFAQLPDKSVMSEAYWKIWNDDVQKQIDQRIEQYRKADAEVTLSDVKPGTDVQVQQISHEFIFGAHIFNFNQLGTHERNERYKALYGSLFNSASIAFYWKKFEPEPDKPRFQEEYRDTEEYWNNSKEPKQEFHWRRPASDPVVAFCESKGIRLHGHTIVWGNRKWQHPEWLMENYCSPEAAKAFSIDRKELYKKTADEIYAICPKYFDEMERRMLGRISDLAKYYGNRLHSWDVVNESAVDFHGNVETGEKMGKSAYGLMPSDYTYKAFVLAGKAFPAEVKLNINDYANNQNYANQTKQLLEKGCKIDIMGSQMHLFNPKQCLDIAEGKATLTPDGIWNTMETLSQCDLPIHLSEITITAPNDDYRGRQIQANIARNLYRMWFSIPKMMGITWWNVVDDCGAPGEPTTSGLFTRNMEPKPSYEALHQLINVEWKTSFTQKAETSDVALKFRGFKGKYRVTWTDQSGATKSKEIVVH